MSAAKDRTTGDVRQHTVWATDDEMRAMYAATDMMEALSALLETDCPNKQFVAGHPAAKAARAALAKARGAA